MEQLTQETVKELIAAMTIVLMLVIAGWFYLKKNRYEIDQKHLIDRYITRMWHLQKQPALKEDLKKEVDRVTERVYRDLVEFGVSRDYITVIILRECID